MQKAREKIRPPKGGQNLVKVLAICHLQLNAYVTLDKAVRKFGINIQINGTSDFSGILKVRNIKVTRMTDNSLIVNGSITSNKITTDNIAGTNGWINLRSGLFNYGSGKLKWDGKTLTVAGSGTFAGEITAKSGKIGKYTITDSYLITGNNSTCTGIGGNQAFWAGSDSSNDAPFHVSYDGSLYASNADISGKINATSGKIGKFNLDNLALVTGDTDVTCAGLGGSSQAFWAGSLTMDDAPFRVGYDGKFHSSKGKIGGWAIDKTGISSFVSNDNNKYSLSLFSSQNNKPSILLLRNRDHGSDYSHTVIEITDNTIRLGEGAHFEASSETTSDDVVISPSEITMIKNGTNEHGDFSYKTSYEADGITFNDGSQLSGNVNSCHAGEVCHYYGNDYGDCGTNNDKYYDLSAFTTGGGSTFGSFHTKMNNENIKINRTGVYCFQVRFSVNSGVNGSADKRVEFVPFVNNTRQPRYAASFSSRGNFSITNFQMYILSLNEGDVIAFDISPIEKVSVRVQIMDISVHVLDYVNKYT